jgi:hypothetical protein
MAFQNGKAYIFLNKETTLIICQQRPENNVMQNVYRIGNASLRNCIYQAAETNVHFATVRSVGTRTS